MSNIDDLNQNQIEILIGHLLGDGSIIKINKNSLNSNFE